MATVEIFPGDGNSFTDSSGNTYTLSAQDVAMENGSVIPNGEGTGAMEYYNNQVYGQDIHSQQWYIWNQSYWASAAAPPAPSTTPTPSPTPTPTPTDGTRNPWQTPFSSDSVFNLPLGSGAQWTYNAQLAGGAPFVNTTATGWNTQLYEGTASDPLITVTVNGVRGGPTGTYQVHIPTSAVPANGTDNQIAIDDTTSNTWFSFGGFTFNGDGTATAQEGSAEPDNDDGLGGNSQNSDWDTGVGAITAHDLATGTIDHMLNIALPETMLHSYSSTSTDQLAPNAWPQTSEDGFALSGNGGPAYTGTVDYGVTVGIPASAVEPSAIKADPGADMLWRALQDHGAMVRNSGGNGNEIVMSATQDADPNSPLLQSIDGSLGAQVWSYVQILANQGPNSVNGGGTPIVALDPPLIDASGSTSPTPTPTPTPNPTPTPTGAALNLTGFHLTFDDEFNSFSSSPNGGPNQWATTAFGLRTLSANGEQEYYSDPSVGTNPFSDQNGVLTITAAPGSNPQNLPYNSGEITTAGDFSQQYGYFEMRAELPQGAGMWPAFWMVPQAAGTPGEIDTLEAFGAPNNGQGGPNSYSTALHFPNSTSADQQWNSTGSVNTETSYNTYGVDWEPDKTTFYFDGKEVAQIATPSDLNVPMYMIANLAVGGNWPGNPAGETGQMKIDYIRAFSNNASDPAVALQTVSSPDGGGTTLYGATSATTTPSPTPTPTPTSSTSEAFRGGSQIKDSAGNSYSVAANGAAQENGNFIPGGGGTSMMLIYNNAVYGQDASSGHWYTWNQSSWASAAQPPSVEIMPNDGSFQDNAGNTFTLSATDFATENGQTIPGGGGTGAMAWSNNQVYGQDKASGSWFTWSGTSWASAAAPAFLTH